MVWRIKSCSVFCPFHVVILLILLIFCNAIDQSEKPTTSPIIYPNGVVALVDPELEREAVSGNGDQITARTDPPTEEKQVEDAQEVLEVEDDDYNVVVLDDEVPWDLTADIPDESSNAVPEKTGPTAAPTLIVPHDDDDDYVIIILEDDVPWDDVAVAEYVKDEFEAINNATANSSMYGEEGSDSDSHNYSPSPAPTVAGSSKSALETTVPPTSVPTVFPTDYPSSLPTISPSQAPSASPTLSCHDKVSYRSPINGLTCYQHRNTNCLDWRHIGLNMTELEALVTSCPITCNIECGSFQLFSAPVSFRLSRVAGFMDPEDVDALMYFSIDFLEGFVRKFIQQNYAKNAKFNASQNTAKNTRLNSNTNANQSEDDNLKAADRSASNDIEGELDADTEINEDDFFNGDTVVGGAIMFEIEVAELTAQNLVEENDIPIGRLDTLGEESTSKVGNGFSRRERHLRTRGLQDLHRSKQQSSGGKSIMKIDESLDIIITFKGFTIGMNPDSMSELLVSGIEGVDFTRELQQSRIDFFSEATVSSAIEKPEEDFLIEEDIVEDDIERNSTFSVLISYLVPIVVIGFALGSLFYHKCYMKGKWNRRHNIHRQNAIERAQIGGMTASPMSMTSNNGIAPTDSNDEVSGGYFNFRRLASTALNAVAETENERAKSTNKVDKIENLNKAESGQSAFTRFVSALNLNLAITKSKNSTDEEEINEAGEGSSRTSKRSSGTIDELMQRDRIPIISDDLVSPMSGDSEKDEAISVDDQQYKPYASVLPPMIVIDNIDGPDVAAMSPVMRASSSGAANNSGLPDSSVRTSSAPLEELDAFASEFRKQLSRNTSDATNPRHPSFAGSFYGMDSSSALDLGSAQSSAFGPNAEDEDDYDLIKGIVSDDWDGDDLFSPIPSNITTNDGEIDKDQNSLPRPEQTSSSSDSDEDDDDILAVPINTPIGTARIPQNYGIWDGNSPSSELGPNVDPKLAAPSMPVAFHRGSKSDGSLPKGRSTLPPKRPPTPERGNTALRPVISDQQHRRSSFPKLTPVSQALTRGSSSSSLGEGHRRKSSIDTAPDLAKNSSSISALSTDDLLITGSKSDSSNFNMNRLEFEAPRKGNWGLVLESSSKTGPRIYAVKDYSPLFGLVQRGDKLLEIDGKNVSQSNLTDVTKLLKGKSSSYPYHRPTSSTMPIVVSRSSSYTIDSSAALENSRDYNNASSTRHLHNGEHNHKRTDSYGSAESAGSRVVEDVDDDNTNNSVYYLDNKQQQSSFDYDSSNEI